MPVKSRQHPFCGLLLLVIQNESGRHRQLPVYPTGGEAAELGNVPGVQLGHASYLEQLHRADDLVAEDTDGAVNARPGRRP